jgi:hypothetical protein
VRGADEDILPDSRLGVRTAPLLLLSRPDVCADLRLDPGQTTDAEAMRRTLYAKARALKGTTGEAAVSARRAIDEQQNRWLETHLSEGQRRRLAQVDLQWEGPAALVSRPALAETLGLSRAQREALRQAIAESRQRPTNGAASRSGEKALARRTLEVLTTAQRDRWRLLLGEPFTPRIAGMQPNAPR